MISEGTKLLIIYFSAAGNCKYVAKRLAEEQRQEALSIVDYIKESKYVFTDKKIGIISSNIQPGIAEYRQGIFGEGII